MRAGRRQTAAGARHGRPAGVGRDSRQRAVASACSWLIACAVCSDRHCHTAQRLTRLCAAARTSRMHAAMSCSSASASSAVSSVSASGKGSGKGGGADVKRQGFLQHQHKACQGTCATSVPAGAPLATSVLGTCHAHPARAAPAAPPPPCAAPGRRRAGWRRRSRRRSSAGAGRLRESTCAGERSRGPFSYATGAPACLLATRLCLASPPAATSPPPP